MQQPNPKPHDGADPDVKLTLKMSAVVFIGRVLAAQPFGVVTEAGQQGLLAELNEQVSANKV